MEKCKIKICALIFLLVFFASFLHASAFPTEKYISPLTDERLTTLLTDVLGIDLTDYTVIAEGGGVDYPSKFGGVVKRETIARTYNSTDSQFSASVDFLNGHINRFYVRPTRDSIIHYLQQPSTSAVAETRGILERYRVYAAKYGIDNAHVTRALSLLDLASDAPANEAADNFFGISNFNTVEEISGNMRIGASGASIGFGYVFNGIHLRNRGLGMSFGSGCTFADTWGLYTAAYASVITEEEAKQMALDAAKNYEIRLMRDDNTSFVVYPDWSNPRIEIGLLMIPGQNFNTELNILMGSGDSGTTREPLGLYPFWQVIVYFTEPVGNIDGVEVGIWGDTKEIRYVDVYGHLGGAGGAGGAGEPSADGADEADQEPEPPNLGLAIALAAIAAAAASTTALVAIKKKRK